LEDKPNRKINTIRKLAMAAAISARIPTTATQTELLNAIGSHLSRTTGIQFKLIESSLESMESDYRYPFFVFFVSELKVILTKADDGWLASANYNPTIKWWTLLFMAICTVYFTVKDGWFVMLFLWAGMSFSVFKIATYNRSMKLKIEECFDSVKNEFGKPLASAPDVKTVPLRSNQSEQVLQMRDPFTPLQPREPAIAFKEEIRRKLRSKGFTEEQIEFKAKSTPQILYLTPIAMVSGLILLAIVVVMLRGGESEDWSITGAFLVGSFIAFVLSVKKLISIHRGEVLLRTKAHSESAVSTTRTSPIFPTTVPASKEIKPEDVSPIVQPKAKEESATLGIVAIGLGLASVVMPYFAAVLFVPATFTCGVIAFRQGDKKRGGFALLLAVVGMFHIINVSDKINNVQKEMKESIRDMERSQRETTRDLERAQQDIEKSLRSLQ